MVDRKQFRQTEIQDLGAAVDGNHEVLGLQIAMNDTDFVGPRQSVGNLCRDGDCLTEWNGPRLEQRPHGLATNQFHGDEVRVVHATELVNGDDVRVIERGRGTGFQLKAGQGFRLRMAIVQRDCLDGHFTAQARVPGAINLAHAAGAELFEDFVRAEAATRRQGGRN